MTFDIQFKPKEVREVGVIKLEKRFLSNLVAMSYGSYTAVSEVVSEV